MAERKMTIEELRKEIARHEDFLKKAREAMAGEVPKLQAQRDKLVAQKDAIMAEIAKIDSELGILREVPTIVAKREPGARGAARRAEFDKYWSTVPVGAVYTLKQLEEATGIPRGTMWGIKEALLDEGSIEPGPGRTFRKVK